MRPITVTDGLTVRFPQRSASFDEGVEIGLMLARMADRVARFEARVSRETLAQARDLAAGLGYRVTVAQDDGDMLTVVLASPAVRPTLRLVG